MSYDYVNDYEFLTMCFITKLSFYVVERSKNDRVPNHELNEFEILNCLIEAINDLKKNTIEVCGAENTERIEEHMKPFKDAQSLIHTDVMKIMSTRDVVDFSHLKKLLLQGFRRK